MSQGWKVQNVPSKSEDLRTYKGSPTTKPCATEGCSSLPCIKAICERSRTRWYCSSCWDELDPARRVQWMSLATRYTG